MTKIKPWERIPKNAENPDGAYITRIGDSQYGVEPYEYGFAVGKLYTSKGLTKIRDKATKYPRDIAGLQRVVSGLGHVLDGAVVDGLDEAIQGQLKAARLAVEITSKLQEAIKDAA